MEEYIAQLMQYERVLDPLDNGNEFDYWIEYAKRMESRKMKYTIELTNKQKAQMDCIMEIVHRYVGFNPKLEPIKAVNVEDTNEYQIGYKVGYNKGHLEGVIKGNKNGMLACKVTNPFTEKEVNDIANNERQNGYNRGLEDVDHAIEVVKAMTGEECAEWFEDCVGLDAVICGFTIPRIIEIAKAYEEKKQAESETVKVGDVIYSKLTDTTAIVTNIDAWGYWHCIEEDGVTFTLATSVQDQWNRTGKHYDIESILKELGE